MNKRFLHSFFLTLCCVVCVGLVYYFSFFDTFEEKIIDRFLIRENPTQNIIIVAIDDRSIAELGQWPWRREVFGDLLQKLQQAKGVAFDINFSETSRYGVSDDVLFAQKLEVSKVPVVFPVELNKQGLVTVQPISVLSQQNSSVGAVNVFPDSDGVMRKTPLVVGSYPVFAFASADRVVEDIAQSVRIDYRGPEKTFVTLPLIDVLQGKVPERLFVDAYVFVGATAPSLQDFVPTPFGRMSGVEFHANALHTIIEGNFFKEVSFMVGTFLIFIVAFCAMALVYVSKHLLFFVGGLAFSILLILGTSLVLFSYKIVVPVLYLELSYILSFIVLVLFQYVFESKEKRFIRKVFQYYLTPDVIDDLIKDPSKVSLGGEEREMTILFSDIRGFTTISEALSPKELTALLNEYLTAMTDIVMEEGGVVDKYIGDAVMAFWGAPLTDEKQADRACKAALRMKQKLIELNVDWIKRGWPELHIGIGLNKGRVVVGNMGSSKRFNYTVMGDEVNFASRLEGITKQYGAPCLVSESVTKGVVSKDFIFRDLDLVLVKGKKEPRRIFDILDTNTLLEDWKKARDLYTRGEFGKAQEIFESIYKDNPSDQPISLYLERCKKYKENPPENWQGVYEFKDK
ncbi:MAG: hypothetical protein RJA61_550 [Candidatus Parcubacteria bacterium]|jgi:adenylate cyclase